ncbi:bile acid:sodium symporter [Bombella sp. ESL0378]|uniref:bile acid:sodium symporter family protein n=1 Tax=Bombella sp. ESL0378 TaxID=2676442 RepID=UPI0012D9C9D6|nr:bile acid:sodium symporter family protein [Bombella sp. ESL0378]MUG05462.1 bile acid:sodium symporter [Bombella sp. ESL0378]
MRRPDPFLMSLIAAVLLASFLPCPPTWQPWLSRLTSLLVILMFFFQGAKLQRSALVESIRNWRLQGSTLLVSFALFPLLGVGLYALCHLLSPTGFLGPDLWIGVLFLCCLPSTVQSSIALTSIARGNVPAAICAATVSNILGILFTPLLTSLLLHRSHGGSGMQTVLNVAQELLLPFIAGQILQPWVGPIVRHHKILLSFSDRGSIIVMVYAAFSVAVLQGLWHRVPLLTLLGVGLVDTLLLALTLTLTFLLGHGMKQSIEDNIALQFCGSKKSLASGVPMANVIFPSGAGIVVLPLMIFHQIQLFVCTVLARHYANRPQ